ncbi:MAG: hypothetical protein DWQ19_09890 [Crenarchaeota archaeon]|nr:MAG: hypothetical protein DWQ19_09890 [Thermoproteota archaeon]
MNFLLAFFIYLILFSISVGACKIFLEMRYPVYYYVKPPFLTWRDVVAFVISSIFCFIITPIAIIFLACLIWYSCVEEILISQQRWATLIDIVFIENCQLITIKGEKRSFNVNDKLKLINIKHNYAADDNLVDLAVSNGEVLVQVEKKFFTQLNNT